ncbi:MAG TPA: TIGR03435 family protein, partial [Vicinamibacterales bacterium]|nr:TIGR03435 family protein [Vicinamibacterales bacterium]
MRVLALPLIVLLLVACPRPLHGQKATPPTFEVASVKPNTSGDFRRQMGPAPGGRFTATNVPLRDLAAYAFGVSQDSVSFRIIGGPSWIGTDHFDVVASVNGTWTPDQMRAMMRALLADRFKLSAHSETRELPIYALMVAHSEPRLTHSTVDPAACEARRAAIQRREPVPPPVPGAPPVCGSGRVNPGKITAVGQSMPSLASTVGQFVARAVLDRTGL